MEQNSFRRPGASGTRRRTRNSQAKSDESHSLTQFQDYSTRDDGDAQSDLWTITGEFMYLHHVCTPSQTVRAERRIISYSVCVHRRHQKNLYVTERNLGKTDWSLLERGWSERIVRYMGRIHKICSTEERPPEGYTWSGERLTRKRRTSLLDDVWPDMWKFMSDAAKKKKAKQRWAIEKPMLDNARQLRENIQYWTKRWRNQAHNESRLENVGSSDARSNAVQNADKEQLWSPPQFWEMQYKRRLYCWNVTDLLSDGKTPYEGRFGELWKDLTFRLVHWLSVTFFFAKDQSRIHQFGKKVFLGLFLGYALYAWWILKGDILVADIEELETMDASEIFSKRRTAKEVIFPKSKENLFFQSKMEQSKLLHPLWYGSDQFKEKVTLIFLEN